MMSASWSVSVLSWVFLEHIEVIPVLFEHIEVITTGMLLESEG
jgi:hypothetical protein